MTEWSVLVLAAGCGVLSACGISDRLVVDEPGDAGSPGAPSGSTATSGGEGPRGGEPGTQHGSLGGEGGGSGDASEPGEAGAPSNAAGGEGGAPSTVTGQGGQGGEAAVSECVDTQSDPENCGRCGHSCLGGACNAGVCQPALVASGPTPRLLAVRGDYLYWTAVGGDAGTGAVMRASKAGGNASVLVASQEAAWGIATDASRVYWTSKYDGGTVRRALLAGTDAETLSAAEPASPLTLSSSHVFGMTSGSVWRVPLAGGMLTQPAAGNPQCLMAVSPSHVYWTTSSTLYRFPVAGGASEPLASNQGNSCGIAVDDTSLVWSNLTNSGTVMIASPNGSSPTPLASGRPGPQTVALDAQNVYWTENGIVGGAASALMSVPRTGGTPKPLKTWSRGNEGIASAVVTDHEGIYWVVDGSAIGKPGQVWKLAKP